MNETKTKSSGKLKYFVFLFSLLVIVISNPKEIDFKNEIKNKYSVLSFSMDSKYHNFIFFSFFKASNYSFQGENEIVYLGIFGQKVDVSKLNIQ